MIKNLVCLLSLSCQFFIVDICEPNIVNITLILDLFHSFREPFLKDISTLYRAVVAIAPAGFTLILLTISWGFHAFDYYPSLSTGNIE